MARQLRVSTTSCFIVLLFATMLCVCLRASAQGGINSGSIQGVVRDVSGSVIPGATVTATHVATGVKAITTTSTSGNYSLPDLAPGEYEVAIEKAGFEKAIRTHVIIAVSITTLIDVALPVGQITQNITVSADSVPINTTSADRGTVIQAKVMEELPLEIGELGRDVQSFLFLSPGVTGNTGAYRVNGGPVGGSEAWFDGLPWTGPAIDGNFTVPFEAVDEFNNETSAYSAATGRGSGIATFHFASGTNNFHGDLYEFLRNEDLDALGYFAPPTKPVERQHEFGFNGGAPVYIPKLYDGRNKTFWHLNFFWYLFNGGNNSALLTMPTTAMLNGDFTQYVDANGNLIPIFDPATTTQSGTRTQFQCNGVLNVICPDRLSQSSQALATVMPTATLPGVTNNYETTFLSGVPYRTKVWLAKIDHIFNERYALHVSYQGFKLHFASDQLFPSPLSSYTEVPADRLDVGRISLDTQIKPDIHNFAGFQIWYNHADEYPAPLNTNLTTPVSPTGFAFPGFSIPGYPQFGSGSAPFDIAGNPPDWAVEDNVAWLKGHHSLQFGLDFRGLGQSQSFNNLSVGSWGFSSATTSQPSSPNFGSYGSGLASFLLGLPTSLSQTGSPVLQVAEVSYYAFYFQDDYRVTPKLTLNMGLRFNWGIPVTEKHDQLSTFDPTVPNPGAGGILGSLVFAGQTGGDCVAAGGASLCRSRVASIVPRWDPRLGFAYRLNDKTVLRGGGGLITIAGGATMLESDDVSGNYSNGFIAQQSPISPDGGITPIYSPTTLGWDAGPPPLPALIRNRTTANGATLSYMGPNSGLLPYLATWSLGVERELPWAVVIDASYVGTRGVRLGANLENLDQVTPGWLTLGSELSLPITCLNDGSCPNTIAAGVTLPYPSFTGSVAQALRPYPQYAGINSDVQESGSSTYHSLQVRAQKNLTQGASFVVAYTLSSLYTNAYNQQVYLQAVPVDTYNRKSDWSMDPDQPPSLLTISGLYQLPFGPHKQFLSVGGIPGRLIGGWQVAGILNYQTGAPIPISGGPSLPLFNGGNRPNVVPSASRLAPRSGRFNPRTDIYLNSAAWSQPAPYTIGNAIYAYPNMRSFAFNNESLTLMKQTTITEALHLDLRAEAYNAFNRAEFGSPNANLNSPGFGQIGSQNGAPRVVQVGAKLIW